MKNANTKKRSKRASRKRMVRKTLDQIKPTTEAQWRRIDAIADADIDFDDIPEATAEDFRRMGANRRRRLAAMGKERVTLYLHKWLLDRYRGRGPGYQTRINDDLMLLNLLREQLRDEPD